MLSDAFLEYSISTEIQNAYIIEKYYLNIFKRIFTTCYQYL